MDNICLIRDIIEASKYFNVDMAMLPRVSECSKRHCSLTVSSALKCCSLSALEPVFVRLAALC